MNEKSIFQSKTAIVGIVTSAIALLDMVSGSGLVPPQWLPKIMLVSGVLTFVARYYTDNKPIKSLMGK